MYPMTRNQAIAAISRELAIIAVKATLIGSAGAIVVVFAIEVGRLAVHAAGL